MPDTSAVTLPQWDKTLLGKGNLKAGMESLGSVIKKASAVKNRLNAIKVLILKAGEKQLQWRVHTTTSGYDTYSSYLESEITPSGLDIVIVNDDVPRAVLSDPAVQAEAQQVELLLHRMIVRFAAMEKSGKVVPEKAYDQLAALLNKYQLWALLINEYELRGVSAPTYAALMDRFRSDQFEQNYLRELFESGHASDKKHRFQPDIIKRYQKRIELLMAALSPDILFKFNSLNFEALTGDKAGRYSIRVNDKYRIEFTLNADHEKPLLTICNIVELSNHYD